MTDKLQTLYSILSKIEPLSTKTHHRNSKPSEDTRKIVKKKVHKTTEASNKPTREDYEKGLELYRHFIEGGSYDTHKLAGIEPFTGDYQTIHPEFRDEKKLKLLDLVFTPCEKDIVVYNGTPVTEDQMDSFKSKYFSRTICSTTTEYSAADFYATSGDEEICNPLIIRILIKAGTPIAVPLKLLGEGGMKNMEKEITIGRDVWFEYKNFRMDPNSDEDYPYYLVDAIVHK